MERARKEARQRTERKALIVVIAIIAGFIWLSQAENMDAFADWVVAVDNPQ